MVGQAEGRLILQTAVTGGNESEKLGITVQELTRELAARLGIKDSKGGLVVTEVKPGSPAEEAGTLAGSIIVEINGQRPDTTGKIQLRSSPRSRRAMWCVCCSNVPTAACIMWP